ncbi:MAG TPA: hypothetical protein DD727_06485 [Clostridiales bacterium]|nr:hypothetical protein [Clostridiales bacterium]
MSSNGNRSNIMFILSDNQGPWALAGPAGQAERYRSGEQKDPSFLSSLLLSQEAPVNMREEALRLLAEYVQSVDMEKAENRDPIIALGLTARDKNETLALPAREVLARIQFKDNINLVKNQSTLFDFIINPGNAVYKGDGVASSRKPLKNDEHPEKWWEHRKECGPGSMPADRFLVLDSIRGPMTETEFNGLKMHYLEYATPTINLRNYHFRRHYVPFMGEWLYFRVKDDEKIQILNKMIDMGGSVLAHRNDHFGRFMTQYGDITPSWPHYMNMIIDSKNGYGLALVTAISDFAYTCWASVPAKIILKDPALWDKQYQGRSYKDIADDFLEESLITINYFIGKYLDKSKMMYAQPDGFYPIENQNMIASNRIFPVLVSTLPLIEIFEELNIHTDTKELLDKANAAIINEFWNYATEYEVNGKTVYDYPARLDLGGHSTDTGHASFDARCLQLLYRSGRYDITGRQMEIYANTLADVVCLGNGNFTHRFNGTGLLENFTYICGIEGFIFLAEFRPELYKLIVEHAWKNICSEGRDPDSRIVWEILKLKEISDVPEGMVRVPKGTAATARGWIRLDYPVYVGKHEVTFSEYDRYCEETGAVKPEDNGWGRGDRPVIHITWVQAVEYANWLSRREGLAEAYKKEQGAAGGYKLKESPENLEGYRLLTSMEWDYVAGRGAGSRASAYPDYNHLDDAAWYRNNSGGQTRPVEQLTPNRLGVFDMVGNVSEWVNDTDGYGCFYYHGSSWYQSACVSQISFRNVKTPSVSQNSIGFRLARTRISN